jgi:hypothetical protein
MISLPTQTAKADEDQHFSDSVPVWGASELSEGPPIPSQEVAAAHDAALREARFSRPPGSKGFELLDTLLGRVVMRLEDLPEGRSGDVVTLRNVPILHVKVSPLLCPFSLGKGVKK